MHELASKFLEFIAQGVFYINIGYATPLPGVIYIYFITKSGFTKILCMYEGTSQRYSTTLLISL